MINVQRIERQMGNEKEIHFDNGIFVEKKQNNILVGKIEENQLKWVELFDDLSDNDKELLFKMLKARDVLIGFDRLFHKQNKK